MDIVLNAGDRHTIDNCIQMQPNTSEIALMINYPEKGYTHWIFVKWEFYIFVNSERRQMH